MPLRTTTIRFDTISHGVIAEEARLSGVSFAQFMREAGLIRACMRQAARSGNAPPLNEYAATFHAIAEEVLRRARVDNNREGP